MIVWSCSPGAGLVHESIFMHNVMFSTGETCERLRERWTELRFIEHINLKDVPEYLPSGAGRFLLCKDDATLLSMSLMLMSLLVT